MPRIIHTFWQFSDAWVWKKIWGNNNRRDYSKWPRPFEILWFILEMPAKYIFCEEKKGGGEKMFECKFAYSPSQYARSRREVERKEFVGILDFDFVNCDKKNMWKIMCNTYSYKLLFWIYKYILMYRKHLNLLTNVWIYFV